jgi:hypothetical protein
VFRRKTTADEVREFALMALASALQQQVKGMQRRKPMLGGVRAVAAGAALYTAGRAVAPRLREQLEAQQSGRNGDERHEDEETYDEEESAEDAPVAERSEDDQPYDEDEYEEPAAASGDDESYEEDEADEEEEQPAGRPRRSRSPVGRA